MSNFMFNKYFFSTHFSIRVQWTKMCQRPQGNRVAKNLYFESLGALWNRPKILKTIVPRVF